MNLLRIGIRPQIIREGNYTSAVFSMLNTLVLEMHCYIGKLKENSLINTMTCIEALQMLNRILQTHKDETNEHIITVSGGMFRRRYLQIYWLNHTKIIDLSYIPLSVLKFLYNQIYIAQDNSDKELLVSDIELFNFRGI